jgi:hypothetical protein
MKAGIASYDVQTGIRAIKKKAPVYSLPKGKQFVLWEEGKCCVIFNNS